MSGIDVDFLAELPPERDFRRANGAPMVRRIDDTTKWDRYSRPSGWGSDLDDESNLVNWRIDRAMEGVACDPSIAATVAANLGISEGRKERRNRAIERGRGAERADIGTALHAMSARVESGDSFRAPPPYDADLAAYLTVLERAGLTSEFIEVKICSDVWRAAGTADRLYRVGRDLTTPDGTIIPKGAMLMGDLKTGAKLELKLPGFSVQLAIYADGCFYDVNTDERTPMPEELRMDWGVLVHLPAATGRCELFWCDLRVGRIGAELVRQVRHWRKRIDFAEPFIWPPEDDVPTEELPVIPVPDEAVDPGDDEWAAALTPFIQERVNAIGLASNEARMMLVRSWPPDIPTPSEGLAPPQVSRLLTLLDGVEAAMGLPWPLDDPRVEWTRGLHRSQIDREHRNQAPSTKEPLNP